MNRNYSKLLDLAKEASANAYNPYSKFNVGAAVLYEDGTIYKGCNVENASYGLCLCAERNALSTAIVEGNKTKPVAVAIYSPNTKLCYPCGACRQWIAEFNYAADIILEDENSEVVVYNISELLPKSFYL
ncbi:MAG: cytidine deaminase [bacterium]